MNIFDFIRRIEALEAERDALLVELAPLRELRAAKLTPDDTSWKWESEPEKLTFFVHRVDYHCAKSILQRLNECLYGWIDR